MHQNSKNFIILLVEDNPGDVRLTREAFRLIKHPIHLEIATDGVEALRYLHKTPPYPDKPLPDLILLDLNLPKKDGREVLKEIKSDNVLRQIPVIVLTTSNARQDIVQSYELHANCFINKPVDFDRFFIIIQKIVDFWLLTAELPARLAGADKAQFYQAVKS